MLTVIEVLATSSQKIHAHVQDCVVGKSKWRFSKLIRSYLQRQVSCISPVVVTNNGPFWDYLCIPEDCIQDRLLKRLLSNHVLSVIHKADKLT